MAKKPGKAVARVEEAGLMWWRAAARSSHPLDSWMAAHDYFDGMAGAFFSVGLLEAGGAAELLRGVAFLRACES